MVEIVGIGFEKSCKTYYFDPSGEKFEVGDKVVVETARGMELGNVLIANSMVEEDKIVAELKPVQRKATEKDLEAYEKNLAKRDDALAVCAEKIAKHELDMKLIDVEFMIDGSKVVFYFSADGRVDFRELAKDLAGHFKNRIELRQIGVRDEAKMLGGIGICGRPLCCSKWLHDFQPVSIKMAKQQNLSLNPTKISGTCGRLMCCLNYEDEAYKELRKGMPKDNERVETPDGLAKVIKVDYFNGLIKCRAIDIDEATGDEVFSQEITSYTREQIKRRGKNAQAEEIDDSIDPNDGLDSQEMEELKELMKED